MLTIVLHVCIACEVANPSYSASASNGGTGGVFTPPDGASAQSDGSSTRDGSAPGGFAFDGSPIMSIVDGFIAADTFGVPRDAHAMAIDGPGSTVDAPTTGQDAAVVTRTCSDSGSCVCTGGQSCALTCEAECRATCVGQETQCSVAAVAIANLHSFDCADNAVCTLDVRFSSNAGMNTCATGAVCDIDCGGVANCGVRCVTGATCLLRCWDASNCGFETCEGTLQNCGAGVLACNRSCP